MVKDFFTTGTEPLLLNPGFEQGASGVPTGWAETGPPTGTLTWASGTAHSGNYSAEITGSGTQAAWTQVINTGALSTGEKLQATVWAEGSAATGTNDLERGLVRRQRQLHLQQRLVAPARGTSNWTELGVDATAPAGADYGVLYLPSSNNTGSVFFDDASVVGRSGAFPGPARCPGYLRRRAHPGQPRLRAGQQRVAHGLGGNRDGHPQLGLGHRPLRQLLGRDHAARAPRRPGPRSSTPGP